MDMPNCKHFDVPETRLLVYNSQVIQISLDHLDPVSTTKNSAKMALYWKLPCIRNDLQLALFAILRLNRPAALVRTRHFALHQTRKRWALSEKYIFTKDNVRIEASPWKYIFKVEFSDAIKSNSRSADIFEIAEVSVNENEFNNGLKRSGSRIAASEVASIRSALSAAPSSLDGALEAVYDPDLEQYIAGSSQQSTQSAQQQQQQQQRRIRQARSVIPGSPLAASQFDMDESSPPSLPSSQITVTASRPTPMLPPLSSPPSSIVGSQPSRSHSTLSSSAATSATTANDYLYSKMHQDRVVLSAGSYSSATSRRESTQLKQPKTESKVAALQRQLTGQRSEHSNQLLEQVAVQEEIQNSVRSLLPQQRTVRGKVAVIENLNKLSQDSATGNSGDNQSTTTSPLMSANNGSVSLSERVRSLNPINAIKRAIGGNNGKSSRN